jgi:hypothetical protein
MVDDTTSEVGSKTSRKWRRRTLIGVAGLLAFYLLAAYVIIPAAWEAYERWHPSFDDSPRITHTSDGHPGDPLNVALIGTEAEVQNIMRAAKWYPAAKLGLKSDLKIAVDTVLSRPDDDAPVSRLYLFGRKEDLAFEQPVGNNPRQRSHVRFWKTDQVNAEGRPTWIGSASYDERVGLSHTTGQITHHIAADVDAERDHLMANLEQTGNLSDVYAEDDFHKKREGRNGGGDPWHTDGRLMVGVIRAAAATLE